MIRFFSIIILIQTSLICFGDTIPQYPDIVYENRISRLNNESPIYMEYNEHVKSYIEAYAIKNRQKVSRIIGLSKYYFPVFDNYLDKYNLPFEFRYLSAVESALNPNAISVSGAVGLWQIMQHTAKLLDLQSNNYIDERRDMYSSTEAACKYLEYLYRTFGDWNLVLAAYNGGPGMVKKAIARSGGKTDYWEIRPYLTKQMQNYVPAFIAMNYVMRYASYHSIVEKESFFSHYNFDTIRVKGPVSFEVVENYIDWPRDSIILVNPIYRLAQIPNDSNFHTLVLPEDAIIKFLEISDTINLSAAPTNNYIQDLEDAKDTSGREKKVHKVLKGETLHKIAIKHRCTVDQILAWNKLKEGHKLKYDETLIIWVK